MKIYELLSWAGMALLLSAAPLAAEETAVVKGSRINVRGRPALIGEVITQLQQGEKVVILEEITLSSPATNEPSKWLRIQMPAQTPVWVYAPFVDPATKTVKVSRLNLRGGPGENFSVVGRLERGASVREIRRVEDWMEIETPPGAYAFIAADLVTKTGGLAAAPGTARPLPPITPPADRAQSTQPAPIASSQTPPAQSPAPSTPPVIREQPPALVATPATGEWQPVRSKPATAVAAPVERKTPAAGPSPLPNVDGWQPARQQAESSTASSTLPAAAPSAATLPAPANAASAKPALPQLSERALTPTPAATEASSRRIVRREGLVRSTISIQAPTYYELLSPANRKTINYLHTAKLGLDLKDYRGRQIVVTGEEAIDPRWPRTPVIEVETLELIR